MTLLSAVGKAFVWCIICACAGLLSMFFILFNAMLFSLSVNIKQLMDPTVVVFLCISLMAGAGADTMLSNVPKTSWRITAISCVVFLGLLAGLFFNPAFIKKPDENVIKTVETVYLFVAIGFCMILKTFLFLSELDPWRFKKT